MRILMTGSTGFTGKCLVRMFEDYGHEIWHLVRNKRGFKKEFVWDFISPLPEELPPCDILVHLAAHVNFSQNLEIILYNINTVSTTKLAAYARANGAYFIFASMAGVHGNQHKTIDASTPINPDNHYGVSKYLSEEVIRTYVNEYSILRICGIYGMDGPEHLGLNRAISDAVHRKIPPVLKGPGKAKRNYICVHDVSRWIFCLAEEYEHASSSGRSTLRKILYLASPEVMTIEDYLELIVETILPGDKLERMDGPESRDMVVKGSIPPFSPVTFKQYLESLRISV
jgi:nucleoside-diphosphate-sugar epimerase